MAPLKDVFWISSPLGFEKRVSWNEKGGKSVPIVRDVLNPQKEFRWLQVIKHWTLEVDGKCYELWAKGHKNLMESKFTTDLCEPKVKDSEEWHAFRNEHGIVPVKRKAGQTRMSHRKIQAKVDEIWKEFNSCYYGFFTQNCQNFARLLHFAIAAPENDPKIPESEKKLWEKIPDPAVYLLEQVSHGSIAARIVFTTKAAYLAALPAAEVVAPTAVAATTSVSTGATGTATVGITGSIGGAGSTAGTAQTAVAGTSHGTAAISAGAAKGTVAGSASVGKVGVAAKLSALGHSAGATKAATVGKVVAMHHPVSGVALVMGAGYLHHKRKKDKKYSDTKKGQRWYDDTEDDLSVADILETEEELVRKGQDPDQDDAEVDEELTKSLELTQITTEPGTIDEGSSCSAEAIPMGENSKRLATVG